MGGCATKPTVLKEEGEPPLPASDLVAGDDTAEPVIAGEESKEEVVDGVKSLGTFFTEKEAEEKTAAANEEKPVEEKEVAIAEQHDEEKKATEASEDKADATTSQD